MICSVGKKGKNLLLWTIIAATIPQRWHKQLKTMKMGEAWRNSYDDGYLILTMRDIYINSNINPLTKFTSRGRSTELKDILPRNISQIITKTTPISMRTVISNVMNRGILLWVCWKVNGDWDNNMIRISQLREIHRGIYTTVRRNR